MELAHRAPCAAALQGPTFGVGQELMRHEPAGTHVLAWSFGLGGGVQQFIASARKGRDLWFGSWLMSEVARAAAIALTDHGVTLLVPSPDSGLDRPDRGVPNRIVALVPNGAEPAAQVAETAARAFLRNFATLAFADLPGAVFDEPEAMSQVDDLLSVAWASVVCTGDEPADRARASALLAARKSARQFSAPSFASPGVEKSSLDGEREAVTRKGAGLQLGLTHDERLCGVGVLKRLGHRAAPQGTTGARVASVSTFAVASWLRPALTGGRREDVEGALFRFREAVERDIPEVKKSRSQTPEAVLGRLDAHLLYANRLHEFVETRRLSALRLAQHGHFKRLCRDLGAIAGEPLTQDPNPYYAILVADGDRMGRAMAGLQHEGVQAVSRALAGFAQAVRDDFAARASDLQGHCVYAGGDDVLAFVPVDVALKRARDINELFGQAMAKVDWGDQNAPTLSVGIGVAHHLTPLRDALDGARDAEATAKEQGGRDAWAIRLMVRSGSATMVFGHWDALARLQELVEAMHPRQGALPRGLPYELREAASALLEPGSDARSAEAELERCELRRMLRAKGRMDQEALLVGALTDLGLAALADRLAVARALAGVRGGT